MGESSLRFVKEKITASTNGVTRKARSIKIAGSENNQGTAESRPTRIFRFVAGLEIISRLHCCSLGTGLIAPRPAVRLRLYWIAVVVLDIPVDVLDSLIERRLHVPAIDDVVKCLGEGQRDVRVGGRRRPWHRCRLKLLHENVLGTARRILRLSFTG